MLLITVCVCDQFISSFVHARAVVKVIGVQIDRCAVSRFQFAVCCFGSVSHGFEPRISSHIIAHHRRAESFASSREGEKLGSPQCRNSSSDDNRDNISTKSLSLVMAQKRGKNALKTKKAKAAEGNEIEMTDLRPSEHGVQAGSLLHMSSLILVAANKAARRHWQTVRADSSAIAQIIQLRDVADELIAAAETETENDENAAIIPKRREFSVCKSEPEGETYYVDNTTGERMRELPDDGFISAEEESDLGQAPQTPEDPPCEDTPQRRLHQFSVSRTEDGDEYFTNNETQETMWDLPDGGIVVEI